MMSEHLCLDLVVPDHMTDCSHRLGWSNAPVHKILSTSSGARLYRAEGARRRGTAPGRDIRETTVSHIAMDEFDYSVQISELDWNTFILECEECDLLPPALASSDGSGVSDVDDVDSPPSQKDISGDTAFDGPPDSEDPLMDCYISVGNPRDPEDVLSGSEEDAPLEVVNRFFERLKSLASEEEPTGSSPNMETTGTGQRAVSPVENYSAGCSVTIHSTESLRGQFASESTGCKEITYPRNLTSEEGKEAYLSTPKETEGRKTMVEPSQNTDSPVMLGIRKERPEDAKIHGYDSKPRWREAKKREKRVQKPLLKPPISSKTDSQTNVDLNTIEDTPTTTDNVSIRSSRLDEESRLFSLDSSELQSKNSAAECAEENACLCSATVCEQKAHEEEMGDVLEPSRPVYAISSFWDEMEKLTINDILQLRLVVNAHSPGLPSDLQDDTMTLASGAADSGFFTQLEDSKPNHSSGNISTLSDFEEEFSPVHSLSATAIPDLQVLESQNQNSFDPNKSQDVLWESGIDPMLDLEDGLIRCGGVTEDDPATVSPPSCSTSRNFQFSKEYDFFFPDESPVVSDKDEDDEPAPIRVITRSERRATKSPTIAAEPDMYEDFFGDSDCSEDLFWRNPFSLRRVCLPGLRGPRKRSTNHTGKSQSKNSGRQGCTHSPPHIYQLETWVFRMMEDLQQRHADLQTALIDPRRDISYLSVRQSDMCLICIAFASWVLRSANPQALDTWKAALLANISALSAIRYLRRYLREEASREKLGRQGAELRQRRLPVEEEGRAEMSCTPVE
ncbi:hypothetical protein GN956_G6675 [Arapaima gigas]